MNQNFDMSNIPEWQYPLYQERDKAAYVILEKLGKSMSYPKLVGSEGDINDFLKLLVLSQKMKDYRKFRHIALNEFKKKEVNIPKILNKSKNLEIPRGIDKSWAIFTQDRRLCELMDSFQDAKIQFIGNDNEVSDFFVRFLLSQLLQDWRGPLMAVLLKCLHGELPLPTHFVREEGASILIQGSSPESSIVRASSSVAPARF